MTTMKPVSKTAYYCCGVRALDAAAARPVCGDEYADRFMTPEAWGLFEPFRGFVGPNASNVARIASSSPRNAAAERYEKTPSNTTIGFR